MSYDPSLSIYGLIYGTSSPTSKPSSISLMKTVLSEPPSEFSMTEILNKRPLRPIAIGDQSKGFDHTNMAERLASKTWQYSSEVLQARVKEQDKVIGELEAELNRYRHFERMLAGDIPWQIGVSMEHSLHRLAEVFIIKYPQEDAVVVKNLVAMFIDPVESRLEEEGVPTEPESSR
jgi:hypothetical protein